MFCILFSLLLFFFILFFFLVDESRYYFESVAHETRGIAFPFFLSVKLPSRRRRAGEESCALVWLGCKQRHYTCQDRKPDICHFIIITSNLLSSNQARGQSWRERKACVFFSFLQRRQRLRFVLGFFFPFISIHHACKWTEIFVLIWR